MNSQNNEEQIILAFFGSRGQSIGTVLDIGANDGDTLSNSFALCASGWNGVMVEPAPKAFEKLSALYASRPTTVKCFEVAISNVSGTVDFYSSGTHLGKGDTDLLSTMNPAELERWKGSPNEFTKTTVKSITFAELLSKCNPFRTFDLITIDAEGVDFDILKQMDLEKLGCKMLVVETNSKDDQQYIEYCAKFGMYLHAKNFENLIFAIR